MNNNPISIKRALLSVSNKTGIVELAKGLRAADVEIVSTGGTSQVLKEAGIKHLQVEDITNLPEIWMAASKHCIPIATLAFWGVVMCTRPKRMRIRSAGSIWR